MRRIYRWWQGLPMWRRFVCAAGSLLLAIFIGHAGLGWYWAAQFDAALAARQAAGRPLRAEELLVVRAPVAPELNAAIPLGEAARIAKAQNKKAVRWYSGLELRAWTPEIRQEFVVFRDSADGVRMREYMAEALKRPACRFEEIAPDDRQLGAALRWDFFCYCVGVTSSLGALSALEGDSATACAILGALLRLSWLAEDDVTLWSSEGAYGENTALRTIAALVEGHLLASADVAALQNVLAQRPEPRSRLWTFRRYALGTLEAFSAHIQMMSGWGNPLRAGQWGGAMRPFVIRDGREYLAMLEAYEQVADAPFVELAAVRKTVHARPLPYGCWITEHGRFMDMALVQQHEREVFIVLAKTALALEQCRYATGVYPATLDAVPDTLRSCPPVDSFGGAPLRYRVDNGAILLYSVGPDMVDNGGRYGTDDVVWRNVP